MNPQLGPLNPQEVATLDATLLPVLERHHLRLLAHGLNTLQAIAAKSRPAQTSGDPPDRAATLGWVLEQAEIAHDQAFAELFTDQLECIGHQLLELAAQRGCTALSLNLDDLIGWAQQQADQRLATKPPTPPQAEPAPPPQAP